MPVDLADLAQRLKDIPGVSEKFTGLEEAAFKKRPSVLIDQVLTQLGAPEIIEQAFDELLQLSAETQILDASPATV